MTKQQSMEKIKKIVDRYKKLSDIDKKKYNEQQTKDHFIRPLFEALGWDFEQDVWPETDVSGKRVDYALKINNVTKFFIEAKPMSVNLDEERWAEQAINYSWHKSVPWVVLTDFEAIKVYNTEWDEPNIQSCQFIEIPYTEYLTNEKLWWLSKEAFIEAVLDKQADQVGRRPKTIIDKQLANDLIRWRDLLYKNLCSYNPRINKGKIAEYVQRILDRLIFIRTLEDRKIEDVTLQPLAREWKEKKGIKANELLFALNKVFRKIDSGYDSGLFEKGSCDQLGEKIDADDNDFVEIIEDLYKTRKGVRYNFADIPADIFGSIYEQYLGHIQQEDEQESKKSKRKSQGIYYTPRWVVDYIIKNTLGETLKSKTEEEAKNIKILDPACGSGSFLITAYQTLIDYWQNHQKNIFAGRGDKLEQLERAFKKRNGILISPEQKQRILLNNIYGVDLDDEAIELARLNLLLKMVGRRIKLPSLAHNIKIGNSLIDDQKITDKAFDWQKNFSEVFRHGGFDVIVGNPPYVKELDNKELFAPVKNSDYKKYYQGKMDFWYFFLHRAIDVAKEGGYIGFITNSYFLKSAGASKLIQRIKEELVLVKAVDFNDIKVFGDVSGRHIIHIYQKRVSDKNTQTVYTKQNKTEHDDFVDEKNKKILFYQNLISDDNKISFNKEETLDFKKCISLGEIYNTSVGVQESTDKITNKILSKVKDTNFKTGEGVFVLSKRELSGLCLGKEENKIIKKYLNSSDVGKYQINFNNEYLIYSNKEEKEKIKNGFYSNIKKHLDRMNSFITSSNKPYGLHRPRENKYFENPKLICKGMFLTPEFCYDEDKYYVGFSFSVIIQKDKDYNLKYLLGILNSKLAESWFNRYGKRRGIGVDIGVLVFRKFPVYKATKVQQGAIIKLVDKIIKFNKDLQKLDPDLDDKEYNQIEKEIEETEREIDGKVYELYGLTEEEIRVVENINKK